MGRHGGVVREGQQSAADGKLRRRSDGGEDGSGGGGGDGGDDGVREEELRRRSHQRFDWQRAHEVRGEFRPGDALSPGAVGRRMLRRRSDGGRGDGGGMSGGDDGVTQSVSRHLSVVMTGKVSYSHLLLACRASQGKFQGLLNPPPPLCQNHHLLPISCHRRGFHCERIDEAGVSDWPNF